MLDVSIAIPAYNAASRLPKLLDALRSQENTQHFLWEIIVVDNNSTDHTAKVVQEYQASWPQAYPLKYYFEPQQGAAFARQRAVEEAKGILIGFLDDDNLPSWDWVAEVYKFGQAYPHVGAYGSEVQGLFEVDPPENFHRIACFFAIFERGSQAYRYEPQRKMLPPGAGLVVRKQAWCESVPQRLFLNHKGKQAKLASEDLEAVLHIQLAGWEIWHNPKMLIHHDIPRWRLEKEYLTSLLRCAGLSRHHIRMLSLKNWQKPLAIPAYFFNDLRRLLLHTLKYRGANKDDLIVACEREWLFGSLISPVYLGKKYLEPKTAKILESGQKPPELPILNQAIPRQLK
jgi:glycosyltransferase involved in cell wall biosynthesis